MASALNSLAAITCEDILHGLFQVELPARKGAIYARWISIFFGALSFALIFVVERLGGVMQVSSELQLYRLIVVFRKKIYFKRLYYLRDDLLCN